MDQIIRIIIADDHAMMAEGLATAIEKNGRFKVLATVQNGQQLLNMLNTVQPDLILLDLNMPVLNGFETCKIVRRMFPKIVVVALTMYNNEKNMKQVKDAGAAGLILKYSSVKELEAKILEIWGNVNNNAFVFTENVAFTNIEASIAPDDDFLARHNLTKREVEIIRLVAQGMQTSEMAKKFFLSEHTINTHRKNILNKLNLRNSIELTNFAIKHQML